MGQTVTVMGQEKKETRKELKKHAATIHCSNTLTLLQRKITNALLYHAYKELMLKEEHEITVKQLCRLIGYQGNNHAVIKDALRGLISTIIEWNVINDVTGSENWTASSIIASVSLEGPLCYYAYSPRMKQLLHSPTMFGRIDLVIQSRFRSSYGLALYENCIRYRGLPHTKWFDIELFKKLMGVPAGKYDVFRDFKRRVLDKAVDEVNTYSDLIITSEVVREGRKVTKMRFKLKERAKKTRLGTKLVEGPQVSLKDKLMNVFGMSKEQAHQLFSEYEKSFIEEKISLVEASKSYQENQIQNLSAYLLSAIKNNYQAAKKGSVEVVSIHAQHEQEIVELKRQVEQLYAAYNAYRESVINEMISNLTPEQKEEFMQGFYEFSESTMSTILRLQRQKYTKHTVMNSPQMKALLRQFALRELDLLPIVSLEEFISQQSDDKIAAWQKLRSFDPDHPLLRITD